MGSELAKALPDELVAVYVGAGKSGLFRWEEFVIVAVGWAIGTGADGTTSAVLGTDLAVSSSMEIGAGTEVDVGSSASTHRRYG